MNRCPSVLLVDDIRGNRIILGALFSWNGYQVIEASNGELGLKTLQKWQPEVAIIDVFMPVMSGIEMVKRISERPEIHKPKVVIMIAANAQPIPELAGIVPAQNIFDRPVDLGKLIRYVESQLALREYADAPDERKKYKVPDHATFVVKT